MKYWKEEMQEYNTAKRTRSLPDGDLCQSKTPKLLRPQVKTF